MFGVSATISYIRANVSIFIFYMKPPCHDKAHHFHIIVNILRAMDDEYISKELWHFSN